MRSKELAFGIVMGVMLTGTVALLCGRSESAYGQSPGIPSGVTGNADVVAVSGTGGGQFVVVVDTARQVMGSYHVNDENGNITLRSVRNYHWDFQMEEFNGAEPRPHEVRAIVEKR